MQRIFIMKYGTIDGKLSASHQKKVKISSALLYICQVTNGLCSEARKSHQLFQEQALSHMLQSLMTQCNLSDYEAMKSNLSELTNKSYTSFPHPFCFLFFLYFLLFVYWMCGPPAIFLVVIYHRNLYQACRTELLWFCYSGHSWVVSYQNFVCEFCSKGEVSLKGLFLSSWKKGRHMIKCVCFKDRQWNTLVMLQKE